MIRSLYNKFIRDTMIIVTVLTILMIVILNVVNVLTIKSYSQKLAEERPIQEPAIAEGRISAEEAGAEHAIGKFSDAYIAIVDSDGAILEYLDTADQRNNVLRVFVTTVLMGVSMWIIVLTVIALLIRSSLVPVIKNMEEQKRFVTDAGHELKTPLSIIIANLDAMEMHKGSCKWTERIRTQTMRLNDLMQNLLEFARFDEKNAVRERETFDASERLNYILNENEERFEFHGLEIHRDIRKHTELSWYMDDFEKLCGIFLDNAAKYALKGTEVSVTLRKQGRDVVMEFSNKCDNLPAVDPKEIFARFYKGDNARTYSGESSFGVGLAIAKNMVESGAGKISARYENGDTVIFTIVFRQYLTIDAV